MNEQHDYVINRYLDYKMFKNVNMFEFPRNKVDSEWKLYITDTTTELRCTLQYKSSTQSDINFLKS